MNIIETKLQGLYIIKPKIFKDKRGEFVKTFSENNFSNIEKNIKFKEHFFSISNKNVLRGMHFQNPPEDHAKLVFVTRGSILDAVLDIRKKSPTYGKYFSIKLSEKNYKIIYIPRGFAHGFLSLEDKTCVNYLQTSVHSPEHDKGVKYNSFKMDWGIKNPIISERDNGFPSLRNLKSLF